MYCEKDSDCDSEASCSSPCGKGKKGPDSEVGNAHPVANEVALERPVINAVEAVPPRYDYLADAL